LREAIDLRILRGQVGDRVPHQIRELETRAPILVVAKSPIVTSIRGRRPDLACITARTIVGGQLDPLAPGCRAG
jgi:hypothetical protein